MGVEKYTIWLISINRRDKGINRFIKSNYSLYKHTGLIRWFRIILEFHLKILFLKTS